MLYTERINEKSKGIDKKTTSEILSIMNNEDKSVSLAVEKALYQIVPLVDAVVDVFKAGGRLFYIGSGTSGRLGVLDASECPPTFGVSPEMVVGIIAGGDRALRFSIESAEDDSEKAKEDLKEFNFSKDDIIVGLSAAGYAGYVMGALEYAKSVGAKTGCIVCNNGSAMSLLSDFPIEVVVGPEIIQGSTRLKAGTAEKMILNMISTASMIKLGYVYDNYMVNVQPTNKKLIKRGLGIINKITGLGETEAETVYKKSGFSVPISVLMLKYGIKEEDARRVLKESGNRLSIAMEYCEREL